MYCTILHPSLNPRQDLDFDELGCTTLPEFLFPLLCACSYSDPEAMVGCDDGAVRVFDMYSRRCTQIIRYLAVFSILFLSKIDQLLQRYYILVKQGGAVRWGI